MTAKLPAELEGTRKACILILNVSLVLIYMLIKASLAVLKQRFRGGGILVVYILAFQVQLFKDC